MALPGRKERADVRTPHPVDDVDLGVEAVPATDSPAVRCRGVRVTLGERLLLENLELQVERGESVAVMGPSGSGKTTLLHCIAGLRPVDAGDVEVDGERLSGTSDRRRTRLRRDRVGMVFQFGELLPELTVLENVGLPLRLRGETDPAPAVALLNSLGLGERTGSFPADLSGGEVQRAAIARALVGSPTVLLADEPTGALDGQLSETVCELLVDQARRANAGLVVATHDPLVAARMDRILRLRDGALHEC
jgi:ABC-type lipoprotein export system ATPase subunit